VISIRDADAMLGEVCSDCMALSFLQRMEMIALMAGEQCTFEPGADYFCEYLRLMQMWAGKQGMQFREAYGVDACRIFTDMFIVGEGRLAERVEVMNEWLGRIGWSGALVSVEEITRLILSGDSNGKGR
jgi:hypothetical protein